MLTGNTLTCIVCFLQLLAPSFIQAQTDSVFATAYRSRNPHDKHSLFMENGGRSLTEKDKPTYSITITVTDIRNKDGVIRFKFYDDATPFPSDKGFLRIVVPKSEITGSTFTATYNGFTSQNMGIALLDDENNNWELDMGWFFPNEGHAFSGYYHTLLRRPAYSDFSFLLSEDKHVIMKMRYY